MDKKSGQNPAIKILFVVLLLVFGALSAVNQLFVSRVTSIIPSEPQVLAASTSDFQSVEKTIPTQKQFTPAVSTSSAQPVQTSDFSLNLPILMYHHVRDVLLVTDRTDIEFSVAPSSLDDQFRYLREQNFQTLSLNDLRDSFENQTPLPPKSVILTFDDGFRDFYTTAFPLIKKYNLRAVMFYVAGYTNFPGYMDTAMLKEVHNSGLVDIQAHTMSHLQLTKLSPEEQVREIRESKSSLEALLGKKINYFAYPYGSFDQGIVTQVDQAGYKLAFGTTPSNVLRSAERLTLPRIGISGFDDLKRFSLKLGVKEEEPKTLPELPEKEPTTSSAVQTP